MTEKQEDILKSALEMFVHKGFHGASTAAIAENAEVSNGSLFHYFRSKDNLIQKLHESIKSEQIDYILIGIEEEGDPKEKIRLIWKQSIQWAMENSKKYSFLHQYKYSPYKRKIKGNVETLRKVFFNNVENGIQKKQIRFMPEDFVFDLTNASVYGMVEYLSNNPVKFKTPEFMKQAFEIFWGSLKP